MPIDERTERLIRNPICFLGFIHVSCAGIGALKLLLIVGFLGPEQFGLVAIVLGICATAANIVDIRVTDLITKLYYACSRLGELNPLTYRASVLQVGLYLQAALALPLFVLAFLLNLALIDLLSDSPISWWWLFTASAAQALSFLTALITYLQRFSEKFVLMGVVQLGTCVLSAVVFICVVNIEPSVGGYTVGMLLSAMVDGSIALALSMYLWRVIDRIPVFKGFNCQAITLYRGEIRFLLTTNLLGYSKLLHRAADVLVVAYFCSDRQTGWYKLARTLTDRLYVLFDAANKVCQPTLLSLLSKNSVELYRSWVKKIVLTAGSFTVIAVFAELLLLPWIFSVLLGEEFSGAISSIVILTVPFFFVAGLYVWVWPILLYKGEIGKYTIYSFVAILLGQYCIGIMLFQLTGATHVVWFALGYLLSYLILFALVCLDLLQKHPALVPINLHSSQ